MQPVKKERENNKLYQCLETINA